jgi:hypothetical protein
VLQVFTFDGKWEAVRLRHNQVLVVGGHTLEYATGAQFTMGAYLAVKRPPTTTAAAAAA